MTENGIWCVIPIKDLENAKTRLAPALSPEDRRGLFQEMAADVLTAAAQAKGLAGVLVLTNDPSARALAESHGARVAGEPENIGQSEAVARAAALVMAEGADGVLTLPADTPLATSQEIESVLQRHPSARPAMTIVPDHARRGSNCLLLTPGTLIPLHFGHVSFEPHLAEAARLGIEPNILDDLPGIALDVDTPEDLAQALATGRQTQAMIYAESHGIAARLASLQS
jgi:2-phospho-L-lactate guanylyltransferase